MLVVQEEGKYLLHNIKNLIQRDQKPLDYAFYAIMLFIEENEVARDNDRDEKCVYINILGMANGV